MTEVTVVVQNKVGLHARPAAALAKMAAAYKSNVSLEANGKKAIGSSILQILSLTAKKDDSVIIRAEGEDEAEVVNALAEIVRSNDPL